MEFGIDELQNIYAKSVGINQYESLSEKHDYDYAQAGQILAAHKAGLTENAIEALCNPIFDDMQMFFIRYGAERWGCDEVSFYARPCFSAAQMREIVLCYESGLDMTTLEEYISVDMPAKEIAKRRYALLLGNGYITFEKVKNTDVPANQAPPKEPQSKPQPQFSRDQIIILHRAKDAGLSAAQLHLLANNRFNPAQMEQILWGFEQNKLSTEQVGIYADPVFGSDQMIELRKSLKDGIPQKRLSLMADPRFSARQMMQLRMAKDLSDEQFTFIAKPEMQAYKMGEYMLGIRQGYTIEQMQEMN